PRRETPAATNDAVAQPAVAVSADGPAPKKRRRRGGRGRRHGERIETQAGAETFAAPKGKPATIPTAVSAATATDAKSAAKKPGFFHRIVRMFKRS
ncbi:MAG TPA: ATP-dependent RNA helicase RhlB, partial [Rudaea sp.]